MNLAPKSFPIEFFIESGPLILMSRIFDFDFDGAVGTRWKLQQLRLTTLISRKMRAAGQDYFHRFISPFLQPLVEIDAESEQY